MSRLLDAHSKQVMWQWNKISEIGSDVQIFHCVVTKLTFSMDIVLICARIWFWETLCFLQKKIKNTKRSKEKWIISPLFWTTKAQEKNENNDSEERRWVYLY